MTATGDRQRLTLWQRFALRSLRRRAGRRRGEELRPEDWAILWEMDHSPSARAIQRVWRSLPSSPRCGMCGAPFAGVGRWIVKPLGYKPSRKNPHICATCVELSPPGGATMQAGIFFADVRGFTASSEHADPRAVSEVLRRFYGCAEDVLFPEAIIDKLIGDEVMAIYVEPMLPGVDIPTLMVDHAHRLLDAVGYSSDGGPFVEVGIGLDYGEAFVGNIGDRSVFDFTAVGDVVNTAARLQGEALAGQIVVSDRVAAGMDAVEGQRVSLELKGKSEPQVAYRIAH